MEGTTFYDKKRQASMFLWALETPPEDLLKLCSEELILRFHKICNPYNDKFWVPYFSKWLGINIKKINVNNRLNYFKFILACINGHIKTAEYILENTTETDMEQYIKGDDFASFRITAINGQLGMLTWLYNIINKTYKSHNKLIEDAVIPLLDNGEMYDLKEDVLKYLNVLTEYMDLDPSLYLDEDDF